MAMVAFAGLVAGLVLLVNGPWLRVRETAWAGERYTPDRQIERILESLAGAPLLTVDSGALATRIEELPAVATATVEALLPDRVRVVIVEKTAAMVWTTSAVSLICAADGGILNDPVMTRMSEDRFWFALASSDALFYARAFADATGLDVEYNETYPGVASVFTPENERIELFDDALATNLGFTVDSGEVDAVTSRHHEKIAVPVIAHHIHFFVPEGQVVAARDWYARHFGGVTGKRWRYDATDLPGINLNFSAAPEALAATRGRRLDHIGFEVQDLEAFCRRLEANGVVFDQPYRELPSGFGLAFLVDPWGTYIELTEGLRDL